VKPSLLLCVLSLSLATTPALLPAGARAAAEPATASQGALSETDRLSALLADLTTFRADVRQLITESSGGVLEESDILFMLKRPHGFYWETLAPFAELIVTNGDTLWNYQPDLLQLTIDDWNPDESELAAQLLGGETEAIADDYSIQAVPVSDDDWEFVLRPLDPASLYERVMLYFTDNLLESILLINTNGQRTLWEFYNRQINEPIDDAVFTFDPPEDNFLDVIDNRTAAHDETDQL
tara:strand:+ start:14068 stop:14781 length:714 start_codon:yes stop_codon:yes gene_type:complete